MVNFMMILTGAIAIGEIIIQATKNTIAKKIDNTLYSTIVLVLCGILGVGFDILYHQPEITTIYIVESVALVVFTALVPQVGYDKVIEIINILIKGK